MAIVTSAGLVLALALAAEPAPAPARSIFKCPGGPDLVAEFAGRGAQFVAIVDAGDGPHALPYRPWVSGPVKLTWSDGVRTLTWSPGVQIMWMDGAAHRMQRVHEAEQQLVLRRLADDAVEARVPALVLAPGRRLP